MLSHSLSAMVAAVALLIIAGGCSCNGDPPAACALSATTADSATRDFCASCKAPTSDGSLANTEIIEASGVVASPTHKGVFYTHNDSGDTARFFAFDKTGADLGTFDVTGATNLDWEDAEFGPCPSGNCLYLGDIGGGKSKSREALTLYRFAEPTDIGPGSHNVTPEVLPLSYPDGGHDAETLLIHPKTGVITLVTKVKSGASSIYEVPLPVTPGKAAVLVKRGEVTPPCGSPRFTGGDVHPDGRGVLLRSYTGVFFYPMKPEQSVADALAGTSCSLRAPSEPHGEAVAWLTSLDGFVTVSEGAGAKVNIVQCAPLP